ncbi:hypothetical protein EMIHUDRAFT_244917 [Emiliania huxleyi CCMP1516]|uniref:J domain-containing protein n=2 Tax=Emiliania huxleyi TaxID=2903 RepID=A0A0D3IZA9_EMIH1|nr:hypothetical protein EMIHUDRAFT_213056 [Emiliania huxleyi CCMP1516]XP_005769023.1 hypothetical protein EMIHUDRAFT_244917 [Emiliania huxleyi CCMP1516]EOD12848.1 hypothetical protein EMIHUDRAFT_213056 [Emiliania huxleyi CCMP1516]EOD16594.1 hypothetical protein EMIHUDRAFT_244917 [Emiliania huxleyi CCMP1516]|eukprot:XP_005765277.1 hypothetical protein EMIHUDRAFT_213056 [Emiliania huxleyi CCMP1516]
MSDAYSKLKVAQLKAKLKERAQSGAGEKEDLVRRLQLCDAGDKHALPDGRNPTTLKAAEFRKALASHGLPCDLSINTRDELMQSLIDALKSEGGGTSAEAGSSAGGGGGGEDADELATRLALQVLELGEAGNPEGVLSLLGAAITRATPFAAQRKAYLSLARIIHPDKLPKLGQATKAFQHLVRAFEVLTAPEAPPQAAKAAARAHTAISRSNDGCFKTHLFCPRCKSQWGSADSGGLKVYCCALCLCDFGCMTAEHRCPLCRKPFEYHPRDYHRQVTCGNARCSGTFGFWLYHVPARPPPGVSREELAEHLGCCTDKKAHAAHAAAVAAAGERRAKKAEARDAQAEAQNLAVWQFLGGDDSQAWLLTDTQLRAVCAANGLTPRGDSTSDLIHQLEASAYAGEEASDGWQPEESSSRRKRAAAGKSYKEESDDDDE